MYGCTATSLHEGAGSRSSRGRRSGRRRRGSSCSTGARSDDSDDSHKGRLTPAFSFVEILRRPLLDLSQCEVLGEILRDVPRLDPREFWLCNASMGIAGPFLRRNPANCGRDSRIRIRPGTGTRRPVTRAGNALLCSQKAGEVDGLAGRSAYAALRVGTSTGRSRSGSRKTTSIGSCSSPVDLASCFLGGGTALSIAGVVSK